MLSVAASALSKLSRVCYSARVHSAGLAAMPPRKRAKADGGGGESRKISTFFKPGEKTKATGQKRSREDDPDPAPLDSHSSPPPTKKPSGSSDTTSPSVSPEQISRMHQNKLEAEGKLLAKKFGVERIGTTWVNALSSDFKAPYMEKLLAFVSDERSKHTVYPPKEDVLTWTTACPIDEIKVVIIGQDPYHGPNQAHGLCFSVRVGVDIPPSLRNMYKELKDDVAGFKLPDHGYLTGWAKQGVLLLNACLTVRKKEPNSHAGQGWEKLTDAVIHWLNDHRSGLVFILWGAYAQKKGSFIDKIRHCVLKSPHPSPLSASRGFFGCKHFSQTNTYLEEKGKKPIDWSYLPKS